ncbi:terpenoid synthase [Schizopora paradoxa]|uniref:Terpene synthase n=1 Tax=Schizopora paradoxa TaxID=27342 RepID=A0A0H2RWI6_9AGAM|nr:terpenoid synthase [Schizopora paradoxa]
MSQYQTITIPDLMAMTPFTMVKNVHLEEVDADSREWTDSFGFFDEEQRRDYIDANVELCMAYFYPLCGREELRTGCDIGNLVFVYDLVCDVKDGASARKTGDNFMNALSGKPFEHTNIGIMTRQFRDRYVKTAGPNTTARFIKTCDEYVTAIANEAGLREHGKVLDLDSYISLRRDCCSTNVCVGLFEYVNNIDLPNEVFDDPVFNRIYWAGIDLAWIANDIYSYKREASSGLDATNIVTVFMHQYKLPLQEAMDSCAEYYKSVLDKMLADIATLRSFSEKVDKDIALYIETMKHLVVGNLHWSYDSTRYFGAEHEEIKRTRVVKIKVKEEGHGAQGFSRG